MPRQETPNTATTGTIQPDRAPTKPLEPHDKKDLFRRSTSLTLMAVLLIALVGLSALVLLRRHRARLLADGRPRKRRRPPPDPWFESSRRLGPRGGAPFDGSDDDTVDLDPGDIRPIDVETDEDDHDQPGPKP